MSEEAERCGVTARLLKGDRALAEDVREVRVKRAEVSAETGAVWRVVASRAVRMAVRATILEVLLGRGEISGDER